METISGPGIEIADLLPFHFIRPQVFKDQVHFCQAVGDRCTGKKCNAEVRPELFLQCPDGKEHIERFLTALHIPQSGNPVVPGGKREVLEFMGFIDKQVIHFHFLKVDAGIFTCLHGI